MAAVGRLSVHFVPNQKAEDLEACLRSHLESEFARRGSSNQLSVVIKQTSDWWLGDVKEDRDDDIFQIASRAVQDVWGVKPTMVREGGSYGGITAALENMLEARALHLPMGQSSDHAHLCNERIKVKNLMQGQKVMESLIARLGLRNKGVVLPCKYRADDDAE
eukprot:Tamp_25268.p1 GENE.Tamp_25268~~Tamp_25268.p1  ORF type:complete len:163 (-),score=34.99 Tamp_25268:295-783(-)